MRLDEILLATNMTSKAMDLQATCLEEEENKLMAENESLCVAKQEIIALLMSRLRPNRCAKATWKLRETNPKQYSDLYFKWDPASVHDVWKRFLSCSVSVLTPDEAGKWRKTFSMKEKLFPVVLLWWHLVYLRCFLRTVKCTWRRW